MFACLLSIIPHQKELYMHSNHDRSSGLPYCNDQVLVQYDMLLVHAFPMAMAVYPLKKIKLNFCQTKLILIKSKAWEHRYFFTSNLVHAI